MNAWKVIWSLHIELQSKDISIKNERNCEVLRQMLWSCLEMGAECLSALQNLYDHIFTGESLLNLSQPFLGMEALESQVQLPVESRHTELPTDRDSHPRPLVRTLLRWLRGALFCLLSSPQIYCWFCWQRYFWYFHKSVWEDFSRTTWEKFIGSLSIYLNSEFIPMTSLESHFSFSVCAFLSFHTFPHASQACLLCSQWTQGRKKQEQWPLWVWSRALLS